MLLQARMQNGFGMTMLKLSPSRKTWNPMLAVVRGSRG